MQVVVERRGELRAECGDMIDSRSCRRGSSHSLTHADMHTRPWRAAVLAALFHGLTWKARRALISLARIKKLEIADSVFFFLFLVRILRSGPF